MRRAQIVTIHYCARHCKTIFVESGDVAFRLIQTQTEFIKFDVPQVFSITAGASFFSGVSISSSVTFPPFVLISEQRAHLHTGKNSLQVRVEEAGDANVSQASWRIAVRTIVYRNGALSGRSWRGATFIVAVSMTPVVTCTATDVCVADATTDMSVHPTLRMAPGC